MLEATQIEKDGTVPPPAVLTVGPVCLLFLAVVAMFIVGFMVFISLIPLITKRDINPPSKDVYNPLKCSPQTVVFLLPKNVTVSDGSLTSSSLTAVETAIQQHLRTSGSDAIAGSSVQIHEATVSTKNSSKKLTRRDLLGDRAEVVDESSVAEGEQLLSVQCTVVLNKKVCTSTYLRTLQDMLATIVIDAKDVVTEDSTTTTTTTTTAAPEPCADTPGYIETVTGNTCQTYADYGFCEEYKVLPDAPVDQNEAKANCCVCGKQ